MKLSVNSLRPEHSGCFETLFENNVDLIKKIVILQYQFKWGAPKLRAENILFLPDPGNAGVGK